MYHVSDSDLDRYVTEDLTGFDLTTALLGIGDQHGGIRYFTREPGVLCGTEEAARIMVLLGLAVEEALPSGTRLEPGQVFLHASGKVEALHAAWKVCLNLVDHLSAVATRTADIVDAVAAVAPGVALLTTRKTMPGAKSLLIKAVLSGGGSVHRLGLSETVLVFEQHLRFLGGLDAFIAGLDTFRRRACEKKIIVESGVEDATRLATAGVDGIQFDKVSPRELADIVPQVRAIAPRIALLAAGGINAQNAAEYAATGVDGLVTSSPYWARPLDMGVRMG